MYMENFTGSTIDDKEIFDSERWQPNYEGLANEYLDDSEQDELVREAFPAIIAALAPLIPGIIQVVTSLFDRRNSNNSNSPAPRPTPARPSPAPPLNPATNNAANSLLALLQNPQVLAAITSLAQGLTAPATGSSGGSVPVGNIINTIGSLATQLGAVVRPSSTESAYQYNELGEIIENVEDPIEQAKTITALLN